MELNSEQICVIKNYPKCPNRSFEYKPESRFLFFWKTKERFYLNSYYAFSRKEIENGLIDGNEYYIENNIVYYKPHLEFRMTNKSTYTKYFESIEELNEFIENNESINKLNLITI